MSQPLKMKDLEAQTGVSREAIHFYLREGLLPEPERPKHNVAFYSAEHVARIRAIKRLQQERSLSLGAIKTMLSGFDPDALPASEDLARFELAVLSHVNGDVPAADRGVDAVARDTGLSETFLHELDAAGVIRFKHEEGQVLLDFRDVAIVEHWARLQPLGFTHDAGYDAGYLQRLADAVNALAEAEVALFLSVFGDTSGDEAAELAAQGIGATNEILTRLRTQALVRALRERVEQA